MKETTRIRTQTFPVEGMSCASCVARVENTLRSAEGVKQANVNLAAENVVLTFDPAGTNLRALADSIDAIGYRLVLGEEPLQEGTGEPVSRETARRSLWREFLISLVFGVPVIALGMIPGGASGISWIESLVSPDHLIFFATTIVMVTGGRRFFRSAWTLALRGSADMNTLVAVGTSAAYAFSTAALFVPGWLQIDDPAGYLYFDTSAAIIVLILFGRILEARAKAGAASALRSLLAMQPRTARVRRNGREMDVAIAEVRPGDTVIVRPGEKIPVDAEVVSGRSEIDRSLITGESMPVMTEAGETVIGGTINGTGSLELRATAVGRETMVAQIIRMVESAQGSKAPVQNLVDKIASVFVPVVLAAALVTFIGWVILGSVPLPVALMNAVAVLIIACPCALGLATPTAIMVGMGLGARHGILIRNAEGLERLRRATTVVFDKTGTLTTGRPTVTEVIAVGGWDVSRLLKLTASLESRSEHAVAHAILEYSESKDIERSPVSSFSSLPGLGIEGVVDGAVVAAGSTVFMEQRSILFSRAAPVIQDMEAKGATPILVAVDGVLAGLIAVSDTVKPSSREAVESLRQRGMKIVMLSGDRAKPSGHIASALGVNELVFGALPAEKATRVKELQRNGALVVMAGDGVNDAPALAQADVSVAMGTGTDVAMEAADITLISGDLRGLPRAVRLSEQTMRTVRQNLFWAFLYNIIGIPVAALGWLHPMLAAGAMALSSVSVVANALRLRRRALDRL